MPKFNLLTKPPESKKQALTVEIDDPSTAPADDAHQTSINPTDKMDGSLTSPLKTTEQTFTKPAEFKQILKALQSFNTSIELISYPLEGDTYSPQYKQIMDTITLLGSQHDKNKNKTKGKVNSQALSANKITNFPCEKSMMIILGSALFAKEQIWTTYRFITPNGTLLSGGSDLYQDIKKLPLMLHLVESDNLEQVKSFAKRAFYEWYEQTKTKVLKSGDVHPATLTCFGNISKQREDMEKALESFASHLPPIAPEHYQYLAENKHLNDCDYFTSELSQSSSSTYASAVTGLAGSALNLIPKTLSYFWSKAPSTSASITEEKDNTDVVTQQPSPSTSS